MRIRPAGLFEVGTTVPKAHSARSTWPFRRGLVLLLSGDDGLMGAGEASPLPGWSRESLDDCRDVLSALPDIDLNEGWPTIDAVPAANFALETGLFNLLAQRNEVSVVSLLGVAHSELELCQLIHGPEAIGSQTIKVKADGANFQAELRRLKALRARIGRDARLRVDFNQTLPGFALAERLAELQSIDPEWIEEPGPVKALAALDSVPVPIALDESLLDPEVSVEDLARRGLIHALVLKPMLLGGVRQCHDWGGPGGGPGAGGHGDALF